MLLDRLKIPPRRIVAIPPRRMVAIAGVVASGALVGAASAGARTIESADPSARDRPVATGVFGDRVIDGGQRARASSRPQTRAAATSAAYRSPDGYSVQVALGSAYPPTEENKRAVQSIVDFLASNIHGSELGRLRMYIGSPQEVEDLCGGGIACYYPDEARMYIPGEESGGLPVEYAATHEYGHHVAQFRSNSPFPAIDWGTKYWASYELVCDQVDRGILFPGAEDGDRYFDNPGEGFADGYAHFHFREAPWQYAPSLRPNADSYAAIERDVLRPWTRQRIKALTGSLGPSRRSRTFRMRLRLDGTVILRLQGPENANYNLRLFADDDLVDQSRRTDSRDRLAGDYCRDAPGYQLLKLQVLRRSGAGAFKLTYSYPG